MRALTVIGIGVAVVAVEFRLNAVDVAADPIGWLLVAWGAWRLAARGAAALALLAAPLSTAGTWLAYRMALVDSTTDAEVALCPQDTFCYEQLRFEDLGRPLALALLVSVVAGAAALAWLARILRTEIGDPGSQVPLRRQLQALEVLVPVVWAGPVALLAAVSLVTGDGYDPVWGSALEVLGLGRVGVLAWFAVVCWLFSDRYPQPERRRAAVAG